MEAQSEAAEPTVKAKRRWPKVLAFLLALFLVFLFTLPEILRMGAVHWLNQQSMIQRFSLNDIDLNIFNGEVALKGVDVTGDGTAKGQLREVYINLAMTGLLRKRIDVEQLRIHTLNLDVVQDEQANIKIAGIALPAAEPAAEPEPAEPAASEETSDWGIGVQSIDFADLKLNISVPDLDLALVLQRLNLGGTNTWQADKRAPFNLDMQVQGAPISIKGELKPFAERAHTRFTLELSKLPLAMAAALAEKQDIHDLAGELSIRLDVDAEVDGEIKVDSKINLDNLTVRQAKHHVALAGFEWQGDVSYVEPNTDTDFGVRAKGNVALSKLHVKDQQADLSLLDLQQLNFQTVQLKEAQQVDIENIRLQDLKALAEADQQVVKLAELLIEKLSFDGASTLSIEAIDLKTLAANVQILSSGEMAILNKLTPAANQDEAAAPAAEEAPTVDEAEALAEAEQAPPFRVQVKQFHIGEESQVYFHDESVDPPYTADIRPLELTVTDIDTGLPEQDMVIALQATINKLAKLNTDAKVRPFGERMNLSAEGELKYLDMPPLSPYAMKAMGYYIRRGQANATFNATVMEDQLDSKIKLKLNKFNIKEGDPEKVKSMSENLSMPLDMALNILRDKQDNIELDLKIEGDINDPQFDASKVINKALGNATKYAAVYVLKQSLQPWGTVFSVASFVGKQITTPRFEPVAFKPGTNELTEEHRQYLEKMATMLNDRPGLDLNICALASEQDRTALTPAPAAEQATSEEQPAVEQQPAPAADAKPAAPAVPNQTLIDLAQSRMDKVKAVIMGHSVEAGRLFTCQPTIDKAEKVGPNVELFL